jgi:putative zinc finger/helix-turn-helix YgiT family protein
MYTHCPYCESMALEKVVYVGDIRCGRKSVRVNGLAKMLCSDCGNESVPLEMYGENTRLIEISASESAAAVSRGLLRKLRECWGLTQREASKVFGAGESAFAKWESGQSQLSTPSALLVQCAAKFPAVMEYLSNLAAVPIGAQVPLPFHSSTDSGWRKATLLEQNADKNLDTGFRLYRFESKKAQNESSIRGSSGLLSNQWTTREVAFHGSSGIYEPLDEAA